MPLGRLECPVIPPGTAHLSVQSDANHGAWDLHAKRERCVFFVFPASDRAVRPEPQAAGSDQPAAAAFAASVAAYEPELIERVFTNIS